MLEDIKPHIAELRTRLIYIVVSFAVAFIIAFLFWKQIYAVLAKPAYDALVATGKKPEMIFTNIVEPFFTAIKISTYSSLVITFPIILYHFWKFVAPGLYENEKKLVFPFVFFGTLMFLTGASFAYFVVFPMAFKIMMSLDPSFLPMLKISEYIEVSTKIMIGFGLAFEMPVITFFLAKLELVTDQTLKEFWRYAVVIIFILAAVLTPPDLFSQIAMAIPLLFLYAISIYIAKIVNPAQTEE